MDFGGGRTATTASRVGDNQDTFGLNLFVRLAQNKVRNQIKGHYERV